jgi:hypothetical protein
MLLQEKYLDQLVDKVVERLAEERRTGGPGSAGAVSTAPASSVGGLSTPPAPAGATEGLGVFTDINAVTAALKAADELARFPLSRRGEIIGKMRTVILDNLEYLAVIARDETGMGRVEDKINKNRLVAEKTPGVEDLTTGAATGDRGITLDEYAPTESSVSPKR